MSERFVKYPFDILPGYKQKGRSRQVKVIVSHQLGLSLAQWIECCQDREHPSPMLCCSNQGLQSTLLLFLLP